MLECKRLLCENSHSLNCLTDTGHSYLYTSSLFMQLQVFHNFHSVSHLDKYRTYHLLTNHQLYSQIIFIRVNFKVIQHVISTSIVINITGSYIRSSDICLFQAITRFSFWNSPGSGAQSMSSTLLND